MEKLNLPELPNEYSNLQALCVYANVDRRRSPRQHLGEPVYSLIHKRANRFQFVRRALPLLWSAAGLAFVTFGTGMAAQWHPFLVGSIGMVAVTIFGLGLSLAKKTYEPTTKKLSDVAENEEQKSFIDAMDNLRDRLRLGVKDGSVSATITVQNALVGGVDILELKPQHFACDNSRLLLIEEEDFEAVRVRGRLLEGRIRIRFHTPPKTVAISSALILDEKNPRDLALHQIAWLRRKVQGHGQTANDFLKMLDVMEGMVQLRQEEQGSRKWTLAAMASEFERKKVPNASYEYLKKLNAVHPTPFSTYLKHIDLTEFPMALAETTGTGSEPPQSP